MDAKALGWTQLIGAVIAGWLGWQGNFQWATIILSLVFLVMAYHHLTEKKRR